MDKCIKASYPTQDKWIEVLLQRDEMGVYRPAGEYAIKAIQDLPIPEFEESLLFANAVTSPMGVLRVINQYGDSFPE